MAPLFKRVRIHSEDFDVAALQRELTRGVDAGAVAGFTGYVRDRNEHRQILTLVLEHYPGMTEASIGKIIEEAATRWSVLAALVVHRVGTLVPGDQIVYVGVSSAHRASAFAACEFIMDFLKTRAPFWKKETSADASAWVEARASDNDAVRRWRNRPG